MVDDLLISRRGQAGLFEQSTWVNLSTQFERTHQHAPGIGTHAITSYGNVIKIKRLLSLIESGSIYGTFFILCQIFSMFTTWSVMSGLNSRNTARDRLSVKIRTAILKSVKRLQCEEFLLRYFTPMSSEDWTPQSTFPGNLWRFRFYLQHNCSAYSYIIFSTIVPLTVILSSAQLLCPRLHYLQHNCSAYRYVIFSTIVPPTVILSYPKALPSPSVFSSFTCRQPYLSVFELLSMVTWVICLTVVNLESPIWMILGDESRSTWALHPHMDNSHI